MPHRSTLTLFRRNADGSISKVIHTLEGGCVIVATAEEPVNDVPLFSLLGHEFSATRNQEVSSMQSSLHSYAHELYMEYRGFKAEPTPTGVRYTPGGGSEKSDLVVLNAFDDRLRPSTPAAAAVRAKFDEALAAGAAGDGCIPCVRNPFVRQYYLEMEKALRADGVLSANG